MNPGDRVNWLWKPRGGYGYGVSVPAVVIKVNKLVTITVAKNTNAGWCLQKKHVTAAALSPREGLCRELGEWGNKGCSDIEYIDDVRIFGSTKHTAAKPHQCDSCEGEIKVGQKYECVRGVFDGEFKIMRDHCDAGECKEAAEKLKRDLENFHREQMEYWNDQ